MADSPAVRPGCEAFESGDGPVAVVLCHGFTGSPVSMRPWAEDLASHGFRVSLPRLPGHGTTPQDLARTRWQDWTATIETAVEKLAGSHGQVYLAGLSMGGALALRTAAIMPHQVAGLMLVNPAVSSRSRLMALSGPLSRVVGTVPAIGNDIARTLPDGSTPDEGAYARTPVAAVTQVRGLWADTRSRLHDVEQPVLMFRSRVDNVVDGSSTEVLISDLGSSNVTLRVLPRSLHVATLDHDASLIFRESRLWMDSLPHDR